MDNNSRNKTANFFKKEGFYVILFVCLCVVATVAAVVAKNSKIFDGKSPVAITEVVKPTDKSADIKVQVPNNATEVKNNPVIPKAETAKVQIAPAPTVQTAAKPALSFVKPVVGTLLLKYQELAQIETTDSKTVQSFETVSGMYITCKIGQDVFSSESGEVVASNAAINYGQTLTIKHENGIKTIYGNLNDTTKVKVGDKVVRGQKIATVGKTSNHYPTYKALNDGFIYFQVMKNDVPVDPITINIKY